MQKPVKASIALTFLIASLRRRQPSRLRNWSGSRVFRFVRAEIVQRGEIERGRTPKPPDTVEAYLSKPEGDGPFPAIVYLHGCGGLSKSTRDDIAGLMTGWGYVTLAVDSFTTRWLKHSCDNLMSAREGDALAALRHLSAQSFVDPQRIAAMGSSQGASVALQMVSTRPNFFAIPDDLKFKAVVAYYPRVQRRDRTGHAANPHPDRRSRRLDPGCGLRTLDDAARGQGRARSSLWSIPAPTTVSTTRIGSTACARSGIGSNMTPMRPALGDRNARFPRRAICEIASPRRHIQRVCSIATRQPR